MTASVRIQNITVPVSLRRPAYHSGLHQLILPEDNPCLFILMSDILCRINTIYRPIQQSISLLCCRFAFRIVFDQLHRSQCSLVCQIKFSYFTARNSLTLLICLPHIAIRRCYLSCAVSISCRFKCFLLLCQRFFRLLLRHCHSVIGSGKLSLLCHGVFRITVFIRDDRCEILPILKNLHLTAGKSDSGLPVALMYFDCIGSFRP